MIYDFQMFWPWLMAALLLGAVVGWMTWSNVRRESWLAGWALWGLLALAIAIVFALLRIIPGRLGLWIETGILFFVAYIAGCFLGGWLKFAAGRDDARAPRNLASPPPAPRVKNEDKHDGTRPPGLAYARGGKADDLKWIKGVGRQNEGRLHGLGIWHFSQIAKWTPANVEWVGSYLAFVGRIQRERWIAQAKTLAAGRSTTFSKRAAAGRVSTSRDDGSRGQKNVSRVKKRG